MLNLKQHVLLERKVEMMAFDSQYATQIVVTVLSKMTD